MKARYWGIGRLLFGDYLSTSAARLEEVKKGWGEPTQADKLAEILRGSRK
jgi:hypothetical protein